MSYQFYHPITKQFALVSNFFFLIVAWEILSEYSYSGHILNNASPTSFLTDFEKAAMNAIEIIHPNNALKGCYFHLSSNVCKKVREVCWQQRFNGDNEFSIHVTDAHDFSFRYFDSCTTMRRPDTCV